MRERPLNKEAHLHRLENQRRIAYSLLEKSRSLLTPGTNFSRSLSELFKAQGRFGSSDRRLYRELVFTYVRHKPWLDRHFEDRDRLLDELIYLAAPTKELERLLPSLRRARPSANDYRSRYTELGYQDGELKDLLPDWFEDDSSSILNLTTLPYFFSRPPLWLRVQKDPRDNVLEELRTAFGQGYERIQFSDKIPKCIKAPADFKVTELPCYQDGRIEIQDISSQILLQLLPERPRGNWLDACAGAGGKTLQLAAMLEPTGKVVAHDPRRSALAELETRVNRAGYRNVHTTDKQPSGKQFDGVLVDAPCSATGTWRRHPFLMRQTEPSKISDYASQQLKILKRCASLVCPGGLLIYCTCSLQRTENEGVRDAFLNYTPNFDPILLDSKFGLRDVGHGITVQPYQFDGDGLYVTAFRAK